MENGQFCITNMTHSIDTNHVSLQTELGRFYQATVHGLLQISNTDCKKTETNDEELVNLC